MFLEHVHTEYIGVRSITPTKFQRGGRECRKKGGRENEEKKVKMSTPRLTVEIRTDQLLESFS